MLLRTLSSTFLSPPPIFLWYHQERSGRRWEGMTRPHGPVALSRKRGGGGASRRLWPGFRVALDVAAIWAARGKQRIPTPGRGELRRSRCLAAADRRTTTTPESGTEPACIRAAEAGRGLGRGRGREPDRRDSSGETGCDEGTIISEEGEGELGRTREPSLGRRKRSLGWALR